MSYALVILPSVAIELTEALNERQPAIRGPLLGEIAGVIARIRERPRRFPMVYAQVHRALTPRFRFAIFFEIAEPRREIVVLTVLHQRRDPALWPKR
jgi:toxin ParE1/3/4